MRTLVSTRLYFGLEPVVFRRGAGRALARASGVPLDKAKTSLQALSTDFGLQSPAADKLLQALVATGLLEPCSENASDFRLTKRFAEFALAPVVPPLPRPRAKELVAQACRLAATINAEWSANPLMISMLAVSGDYMTVSRRVGELTLWPVVKRRAHVRNLPFCASLTKGDGASKIGTGLRALSSFIVVRIVTEESRIARPFAVPFRDHSDDVMPSPTPDRSRTWGSSLRRQLTGR